MAYEMLLSQSFQPVNVSLRCYQGHRAIGPYRVQVSVRKAARELGKEWGLSLNEVGVDEIDTAPNNYAIVPRTRVRS